VQRLNKKAYTSAPPLGLCGLSQVELSLYFISIPDLAYKIPVVD
jgi:hypothetical protein